MTTALQESPQLAGRPASNRPVNIQVVISADLINVQIVALNEVILDGFDLPTGLPQCALTCIANRLRDKLQQLSARVCTVAFVEDMPLRLEWYCYPLDTTTKTLLHRLAYKPAGVTVTWNGQDTSTSLSKEN